MTFVNFNVIPGGTQTSCKPHHDCERCRMGCKRWRASYREPVTGKPAVKFWHTPPGSHRSVECEVQRDT